MKLIDVHVRPLYMCTELVIQAEKSYAGEVLEVVRNLGSIDKDAEYEVIVRKRRKGRTLDQNAYAWELIGKLSRKLRRSPTEIYREVIRDMPTYDIVPIHRTAVEHWIYRWEKRGTGWICEDMGARKDYPDYRNIKCFYGTSTFTAEEMSQFIDLLIEECHAQDIGTLTPKEIEKLKGLI